MTVPRQILSPHLSDYLEVMTQAVFQAGMSWALIEAKWPAFKLTFKNFDPGAVAALTDDDVDSIINHAQIVRSRRKIKATIHNAQALIKLDQAHGGFVKYLGSKSSYVELSLDIQKTFQYVGELSVYYFLFRVGQPVPPFESWIKSIEGHHPRMKEMVEHYQAS